MMKSQPQSLKKPNALMTPYCGQTQSKTASFRLHTGLTHVEDMGSLSTPKKFRFAQHEVEFTGFEITSDSVQPCKKYIKAIADFPTPQNLTDIRSWFGLVNQVS